MGDMTMEDSRIASDRQATKPRIAAPSHRCKIALYGFGSQPLVHRHLIDLAKQQKLPLSWCTILTTPYYRSIMGEVLPPDEILDVFRALPRKPIGGDLSCLARYCGSLVEDLAAQKRTRRNRSGQWLLDRGTDYYRLYKAFLAERGATHVLMPVIETPDAKIVVAAAQELGLGVIAPIDMRNMTGTYFSTDCCEMPPAYAVVNREYRAQAAEFIDRFLKNPTPARSVPSEIASSGENAILPTFVPSLWRRIMRFAMAAIERPDIFDHELLRIALMAYTTPLRGIVRGVRKWRNSFQYDIADVEALPDRSIFYPLQYSPEASINTPAPYFVDQMRAIDALRFAMPSDYMLVVKEHPASIEMRPTKFMRRLRKLPGVIVIKASVPSIGVIKRAALTVTITGTAAFEAFLLGQPAIALGPGISAWVLGRMSTIANLRTQILNAINQPLSDEFVIEQLAKLMSVRYAFFFDTPHLPGEPMLRLRNMQGFLSALFDHLERERGSQTTTARSIA
jgi:hypothetical protein